MKSLTSLGPLSEKQSFELKSGQRWFQVWTSTFGPLDYKGMKLDRLVERDV